MYFSKSVPIENFIDWINIKFLFYTAWQIKPDMLKNDPELLKELTNKLDQMSKDSMKILSPAFIYGHFRAQHLNTQGIIKINMPNKDDVLITFKDHNVDISDTISIQVVTLGQNAVEKAKQLKENSQYLEYFYWHGFCAALTEALAAKVHAMVRLEMGIENAIDQSHEKEFTKDYPGKRLSFGYEALPNILEQKQVLELLDAETIGISTTESGMLEPEYSTCAIVFKSKNKV